MKVALLQFVIDTRVTRGVLLCYAMGLAGWNGLAPSSNRMKIFVLGLV